MSKNCKIDMTDCRFLSDVGNRPLRSNSNDMRQLLMPRTHNKLDDRSFCRPPVLNVELLSTRTMQAGTDLQLLRTISEVSFIWLLVTLLNLYVLYK